MKRIGSIVCLVALIVVMTASTCFGAQSLKITETYPRDGQKNTTKENLCVKLTLSGSVGDSKELRKANNDCFKITNPKGKELPIRVFYDPEDTEKVLVLADTSKKLDIEDNSEYVLTVSKDLKDTNGNTLGEDQTVKFTTMNQSQGTTVYMIMMVIMFVGMFGFTALQAKKEAEKNIETKAKEMPFNPYKEAKRTGKSVQEVIRAHEKEEEKKKAKEARKAAKIVEEDDYEEEEEDNGNYRVKGPRPVSSGGSTYKTGRKALAEARKAEEERLARRRAANKKKKK